MSDHANLIVEEIRLSCSDGIEIAGQRWTKTVDRIVTVKDIGTKTHSVQRVLCLHGFLDNCRSFHFLAPYLVSRLENVELIALDFPGHGLSSHRSMDSPPMMIINDLCYSIREACRSLEWEDEGFVLIGHSLGSIISLMYAATFPEHVQKLILLDGYGPDNYDMFAMYMEQNKTVESQSSSRPKSSAAERIQRHVRQRYKRNVEANRADLNKPKRSYKNILAAVQARLRTAELSPGSQWISRTTALELVQRAVEEDEHGKVRFIHDARLHIPPLLLNTLDQVDAYWNQIQCPTLWLRAFDGWPFPKVFLDRAEVQLGDLGKVHFLPGSHHFHADPDSADAVACAVLTYIVSE